jgi:hypothetical protein
MPIGSARELVNKAREPANRERARRAVRFQLATNGARAGRFRDVARADEAPELSALRPHHRGAPLEALLRPLLGGLVVLGERARPPGQDDPGLLRRDEDVDVGRETRGLVEGADADEAEGAPGAGVVAPEQWTTIGRLVMRYRTCRQAQPPSKVTPPAGADTASLIARPSSSFPSPRATRLPCASR